MAIRQRPEQHSGSAALNGVIFRKRPVINRERTAFTRQRPLVFGAEAEGFVRMLRLLKILFTLAVLVGTAVLGYAYLGDLSPQQTDVSQPVVLDGN